MYRRPRSLEILLAIRSEMSEEAGFDVRTFVEMVRTGEPPANVSRTVTRVEGDLHAEAQAVPATDAAQVEVADE